MVLPLIFVKNSSIVYCANDTTAIFSSSDTHNLKAEMNQTLKTLTDGLDQMVCISTRKRLKLWYSLQFIVIWPILILIASIPQGLPLFLVLPGWETELVQTHWHSLLKTIFYYFCILSFNVTKNIKTCNMQVGQQSNYWRNKCILILTKCILILIKIIIIFKFVLLL